MAEVREFRLPDLGEGLTEAEIVRWLVRVGDVVVVDQPVVEVETAKAMVEVPCPYGGVVTALFGEPGDEIPVGSALVTVAVGPREGAGAGPAAGGGSGRSGASDGSGGSHGSGGADGSHSGDGSGSGERSGNVLVGYGTSGGTSRRRTRRPAVGLAGGAPGAATGHGAKAVRGAAPADAVAGPVQPPVMPLTPLPPLTPPTPGGQGATGPVAVISPLVRRLAREHGLDLRALTGSGPDGLIMRSDVERAASAAASGTASALRGPATAEGDVTAPPQPAAGALAPGTPVDGIRVPLRGLRRTVADKLSRSRREIPDATCWVDADATELLATRSAMNAGGGDKVSLLAVLARVTTAALARFPALNSTVDLERQEIVHLPRVNLGFAAQTDRGLVVPVIRDAHAMNTGELSAKIARLTASARSGTLTPAELTGGTFTLNNYGVFGVDGSTPIINHPETAMLGVGRIAPKPWVHRGELAVRHVVQLSFTFDHRVCDGGTAGGFLRFVADCVEQPAVLLRHL